MVKGSTNALVSITFDFIAEKFGVSLCLSNVVLSKSSNTPSISQRNSKYACKNSQVFLK